MAPKEQNLLDNRDERLSSFYHVVARSTDIDDSPTTISILGRDFVFFRRQDKVVAFEDRCPHRGAPLSIGDFCEDYIECGYHGWKFGYEGAAIEIPALGGEGTIPKAARLSSPYSVVEKYGLVFVALEEPKAQIIEIEEFDDPNFDVGYLETFEARQHCAFLADNFLDVAHFPFVHKATFGDGEEKVVGDFEIVEDGTSFTATYEHSFSNREDPLVHTGEHELVQRRRLTYRYVPPFQLTLRIDFLATGGVNTISFFITPTAERSSRLYSFLVRNDLGGSKLAMGEAVAYEEKIIVEDLAIQEAYNAKGFPLSASGFVNTRADRVTSTFRRKLREALGEDTSDE